MTREDESESTIEKREETIGGYKVSGSWSEIVEHGERVSAAVRRVLKRRDIKGNSVEEERDELEEFDEWRPKVEDNTGEISERTAEKASVDEGPAEKEGKTVKDSVDDAQSGMKETVDSASKLETEDVKENVSETVSHTQDATDSFLRKALRWLEENVYQYVMTAISPYYFDNELINANLTDKRGDEYGLEVNISDDSIRDDVREEMEQIDSEAPRWRVETEVNTEPAEEVEGVQDFDTEPMKDRIERNVDEADIEDEDSD